MKSSSLAFLFKAAFEVVFFSIEPKIILPPAFRSYREKPSYRSKPIFLRGLIGGIIS